MSPFQWFVVAQFVFTTLAGFMLWIFTQSQANLKADMARIELGAAKALSQAEVSIRDLISRHDMGDHEEFHRIRNRLDLQITRTEVNTLNDALKARMDYTDSHALTLAAGLERERKERERVR